MSRHDLIRPITPAALPDRPAEAPPLSTREGWDAYVHRLVVAPDLRDCAPLGTVVAPTDPRMRYHGEMLPVMTPALRRGLLDARRMLRANRFRTVGRAQSAIVDGDRGTGKSTLLALIGRGHQGVVETTAGPDPERIPVVYVNVPSNRDNTLHWSLPFAEFLGLEHTRAVGRTGGEYRSTDTTVAVTHVMRQARTRLVLIDGVERIRDNELRTAFDYFQCLQDQTQATFVYCGTGARDVVQDARGDRRRTSGPIRAQAPAYDSELPVLWVDPIPYTSKEPGDWEGVVGGFDDDLRLYEHRNGDLVRLSAYLHRRTGGYIDSLNQLVCQAAQEAIDDGTETITEALLDSINIGRETTDHT